LLIALAVAVAVPLLLTDAPQDDSYISYRYASHFAEGHGMVFNPGEPPVEGYTNFLWTLLIALGIGAGLDPEWLGPALGLACTLGAAALVARLVRLLGGSTWFAVAGVLLFAVQPTQTVHAAGGLETSMFAMWLLAGLLPRLSAQRSWRHDWLSSLFLGFAALTRPEGMLVFGLLEIADAVAALRRREGLLSWLRSALIRALPFALIVGLHLAWRYTTYGDWVPNTFHAKVGSGATIWAHGFAYSFRGLSDFGLFLFVLPYFLMGVDRGRQARLCCLLISTIYLVYVGYVGGDYMPTYRFLLPVIPIWCALAASSFSVLGSRLNGSHGPLLAGLMLMTLATVGTAAAYSNENFWGGQDKRHADLVAAGKKLDEVLPADAWIAATNAGRVPYFARRRCIDMMGLSDKHISRTEPRPNQAQHLEGHLKGDGGYVLDRQPEAIVFLRLAVRGTALAEDNDWFGVAQRLAFSISESEIVRDPRFRREYTLCSLPLPDGGGWLNVFVRAGTLDPAALPEMVVARHSSQR
jgi:arabinofuranosyltransferase